MSSLKSKLGFVLVSLYVLVIARVHVTDLGGTGSMISRNAKEILTLPGLILLIIPLQLGGVRNLGSGNSLTTLAGALITALLIYFISLAAEALFRKAASL